MENRRKRPGGAEKVRNKKLKSLEAEAAKCSKLTDLFRAGVSNVSLGLAKLHFETRPKRRRRFYIECDAT